MPSAEAHYVKHSISLALFLASLWWVLSGYAKPLLLGYGVASVLFTVWLARRMRVIDEESHPLHLAWPLIRYWLFLLKEIVVSNVQVIKLILSPTSKIEPHFVQVEAHQNSDLGRTILANSITLTPGTVTVSISDQALLVHALTRESAQGVIDGALDQRVPGATESGA